MFGVLLNTVNTVQSMAGCHALIACIQWTDPIRGLGGLLPQRPLANTW